MPDRAALDDCLKALHRVTRLINSEGMTKATFHRVTSEIRPWLRFDTAGIGLLAPGGQHFDFYLNNYGSDEPQGPHYRLRAGSGYGWGLDHRQVLTIPDITQAMHFEEHKSL